MLKFSHVLDISKSLQIGWKPKYTNAEITREITKSIIEKDRFNANLD